jgi:hypothetical protein
MSDGQILKPDKDFSKEVDKQLPEAESLALVMRHNSIAIELQLTSLSRRQMSRELLKSLQPWRNKQDR